MKYSPSPPTDYEKLDKNSKKLIHFEIIDGDTIKGSKGNHQ